MSLNKMISALILLASFCNLNAQNVNYSSLEKRFVKKELSGEDTIAFRKVGEQKVQQLFDKSQFYIQNHNNSSNQVYVMQQIPDLFYISPGDTLDVNGLLHTIERMEEKQTDQVKLLTIPAEGYLGMVATLNRDPNYLFHLVLMQIPKNFGKEQEMVWQVFLHKPQLQDSKQQKYLKKNSAK